MGRHILDFCVLVVGLVLLSGGWGVEGWMRPTPSYERAMNASVEAAEELKECRAQATMQNLKDIACFEAALRKFPYNATWAKQLGALCVMSAQRRRAQQVFNQSAYTILEANALVGFKSSPIHFHPVTQLKLYYSREKEGGLELAKVMAFAAILEYRDSTASEILREAISQLEEFDDALMLYQHLDEIEKVIETKREQARLRVKHRERRRERLLAKMKEKGGKHMLQQPSDPLYEAEDFSASAIAEELPKAAEELATRLLSAHLTVTTGGYVASVNHTRTRCGISVPFNRSRYEMKHLLGQQIVCLMKWGQYRGYLRADGPPQQYGALLRSPLHTMAAYGTNALLQPLLDEFPLMARATDNFGRIPLHTAVSHGNAAAVEVLLKAGDAEQQLRSADGGNVSPLQLGCSNSAFRDKMMEIAKKYIGGGSSPCGTVGLVEEVHDDGGEDLDRKSGWKGAGLRELDDDTRCGFDLRSGSGLSHHELVGRYLYSSRPVVLRDVVPKRLSKLLRKGNLRTRHGAVLVRLEEFPAAELHGGRLYNVSSLGAALQGKVNATASVEATKKHVLRADSEWVPERLLPHGEGYTTAADSNPLLVVANESATTNHVVHGEHTFFALVHGVQDWVLGPPQSAFVTGRQWMSNVTDSSLVRCSIQSGEVLIIPALWSFAFRSVTESVGIARRFRWK